MNFLWVVLLFLLYVIYSYLVDHLVKEEKRNRKMVGEELIPIVNEQEKKYNLKAAPFLNLRIMSIFLRIEKPEERESLREILLKALAEAKLKPAKFLLLTMSKFIFFAVIIYLTVFFFQEEPNQMLSYATLAVIALSLILSKRYILMIVLMIFGFLFYPSIPASVMLLILMNRLWSIFKK